MLLVCIPETKVSKAENETVVVPDDYPTIQEAIDNAPVGGTVFVRSGDYRERVQVTKPLTLLGEDPETTVISISGLFPLVYGAIEVQADNVTISGFTLKSTWIGIWTPVDYSEPPRSRCKIFNNNIVDNFRSGISIDGENHVIHGNNITGNGESGIKLSSSNSTISGNNITGNDRLGIIINSCGNVTLSNNTITGNSGGVNLGWDGPFYVYGNDITDNEGPGIEFAEGCYNSTVYQNNIARNNVGVNLLNFKASRAETIGWGNIVYRNNIVDNLQQAVVDKEWDLAEMFPEKSSGTDLVYWDNEEEGNYWSDYQTKYPNAAEVGTTGTGNTSYLIDENNADHHPLMNPVTISLTPPPYLEPRPPPKPSDSPLKTVAFVAAVATLLAVILFIYRKYRK